MILCCAAISGCATFGSVPPAVSVPVAVSCLKEPPPAVPATTDEAALLAMDDYAATLTAWTERLLLKAYSAKADALLQACR